jgi:hypothetical protein
VIDRRAISGRTFSFSIMPVMTPVELRSRLRVRIV